MRRRLQSKRLPTGGSGASAVPSGSVSEAMNQIGYGLFQEWVVDQSQRRPIDFVREEKGRLPAPTVTEENGLYTEEV
jgi:hypothetical protein